MKPAIAHLRANVVAYLALFVALGGTSYAAVSIPGNSVGTRQLRNGAVTANKLAKGAVAATKLDGRSIAGYVAFWASIDQTGHVLVSSEPAVTMGWGQQPGTTGGGTIQFHANLPPHCFALADVTSGGFGSTGSVTAVNGGSSARGQVLLQVFMRNTSGQGASLPIDIADICP